MFHVFTPALSFLLTSLLGATAFAQNQIRTDGRLLDANPSLGGRYNDIRQSPLQLGANPYATGNVRFGQSLRSFSPVQDPASFRASLGSGSLSPFLRDSFSGFDAARAGGYTGGVTGTARAFYDPTVTAPTVGFLRGLGNYTPEASPTRFPTEPAARSGIQPGLLNSRAALNTYSPLGRAFDTAALIDPRIPRIIDEASARAVQREKFFDAERGGVPGPVAFEPGRITPIDPATGQIVRPAEDGSVIDALRRAEERNRDWQRIQAEREDRPGVTSALRPTNPAERVDLRIAAGREPIDHVLRGDVGSMLDQRNQRAQMLGRLDPDPLAAAVAGPTIGRDPSSLNRASPLPGAVRIDPALLPGGDVFADMQLARAYAANPGAEWFKEIKAIAEAAGTVEGQKQVALETEEFLSAMLNTELITFVGKAPSQVNEALLKAEALMDAGDYRQAADQYGRAHSIEPSNPLPLIGLGHALLALGDYSAAANDLVRGMERYPDLARFRLDLKSFMGGGEIIDIRRAAIMRLLEQDDQTRLRFLLGYLEYHTGRRESGMRHLEAAAARPDAGLMISRYPELLRAEGRIAPADQPAVPSKNQKPPSP